MPARSSSVDTAFPRVLVSKALMPAWAECDGQCSDITVWAGPGTTYSETGPGDTWGISMVALVTEVKGLGSRQSLLAPSLCRPQHRPQALLLELPDDLSGL